MKKILGVLVFLALAYFYYSFFINRLDTKDTAFFGGDTWEYQSMGVNFAKGHGIQKFGAMEPFDTYKFEKITPLPDYYQEFFQDAGSDDFNRTPAYPYFLGLIYTFLGISPHIAKIAQLLLLIIIAAGLPFVGYFYWGIPGFLAGIPAGALYMATDYKLAGLILTEPLIAFSVFFFMLAFMLFEASPRKLTAFVLGLSMGFALLVKGSLVFIPILAIGLLLVKAILHKNKEEWIRLLVVIVATYVTIFPWSAYASRISGDFVLLSTQGTNQILADNNELCIDGDWHQEWVKNPAAFYYNDGIDKSHALQKVVNFYVHNPELFPRCMYAKFRKGYKALMFMWIFLGFLALDLLARFLGRLAKSKSIFFTVWQLKPWVPASMWIAALNFLLVTLVFHAESAPGITPSRLVAPMDFIWVFLCCFAFINIIANLYRFYFPPRTRRPARQRRR
ncbi:MAG TPA: hypothetical protein VGK00_11650 [Anaerolineales bacterium]